MITVTGQGWPTYNQVSSVSELDNSGITEPVTVEECKNYMRIEGWGEDDSPSTEFSFDDDLISELISSSRQMIEQLANVSLIEHEYEVLLTNMGGIELPFSPINEVISVVDSNDDVVDADLIKVRGNDRKYLKTPSGCDLTVIYTTTPLIDSRPLTDIKRIVAALYEHRGMDINDVVNSLNLLLPSYSRKSAIA